MRSRRPLKTVDVRTVTFNRQQRECRLGSHALRPRQSQVDNLLPQHLV